MIYSVFCTTHIAVHCIFHDLLCILHCSHCSTLHIFNVLLCILHCSHCSTMHIPSFALYFALLTLQYTAYFMLCSVICPAHIAVQCIFHDFFLYFTLLNCSTLHIPRFVLYFALLTLQHIAYIPCLISVFCTAHISANYKFPALFCILHCPHCSTLHIFHALFCILHCSHCSKLQIRCFVLYFALHTLQHIAQS